MSQLMLRLKTLWAWLIQRRIPGNKALIVTGVALAFFIQLYNCFGMTYGAEDGNTRFVQTFLAPWLQRKAAPRDMITVVVYDKASFEALDIDVPFLSYARQAELLYKVAAMKPAAIFIDANYRRDLSDPAGVATFRTAIDRVRNGRVAKGIAAIPVYIGEVKPPRPSTTVFASASDFFSDAPRGESDRDRALKTFGGFHDDAVAQGFEVGTLFIPDHVFDYPAITRRQFPDAAHKTIETPAFRLYRDVCNPTNLARLSPTTRSELRCSPSDLEALREPEIPPMAVQWLSYNGGDTAENATNSYCQGQARGSLLTSMSDIAHNIYRKPARRLGYVYNPCLYLRTVTLNRLLGAPAGDATLARNFTGKVVMIGSALGDDSIVAPDQGKVPGVLLHAMALENLLTWGADYHRWPQEIEMFGGSINIDFFIDLILIFLASRVARDIEARFKEKDKGDGPHPRENRRDLMIYIASAIGVSVVLSVSALIVTYSWLHWTPINAQAITLSALAVAGIEKYREILIEATKWSVAGIMAFLITAGLVSWFALSVFITNDIFDRTVADRSLILWSGLSLLAWTGVLIYVYRKHWGRTWRAGRRYLGVITGANHRKPDGEA